MRYVGKFQEKKRIIYCTKNLFKEICIGLSILFKSVCNIPANNHLKKNGGRSCKIFQKGECKKNQLKLPFSGSNERNNFSRR